MTTKVPKTFLTNIYLGDEGPYAGHHASPCYCGESVFESDDEIILGTRADGTLMLMHRACTPIDSDDYNAED